MGCEAPGRAFDRHAGCFDLRPRPSGAETPVMRDKILSGRIVETAGKLVTAKGDKMTVGNGKSKSVKFRLDGKEVEALDGEATWQAPTRLGPVTPHLCSSPEPGYRADGNCRACMVEIEGERVLAASCIRKPAAGMKVNVSNDRATTARKMIFDLLVSDQPERATSHDPESKFWAWADKMGVETGRFPERERQPAPDR